MTACGLVWAERREAELDLYSRMVAFLKVLLPLAALGLLSTLFLLSRSVDPTATIPFSDEDAVDRMTSQQVTAPFFSGTTSGGDDIIVKAAIARPGGAGKPAEARDITARIIMADGVQITMTADTGSVAFGADLATFSGNVHIDSTSGFTVSTETLVAALHDVAGNTPGSVTGTGPVGTFTAGSMEFAAKNKGGPVHMLFKNGVKLIYNPKEPKE